MFTGLVEAMGRITRYNHEKDGVSVRLSVTAPFSSALEIGESVALNGICLTVVEKNAEAFVVQATPTTLALTTLGSWQVGTAVNLERSVTPATRLGGHWVLGHIDSTGTILDLVDNGDASVITVRYPTDFSDLVLPLGSITIDGVSLTVVSGKENWFTITVIPHTKAVTTLGNWRLGQSVNLEFDVLGKYVKHLLQGNGENQWLQKD